MRERARSRSRSRSRKDENSFFPPPPQQTKLEFASRIFGPHVLKTMGGKRRGKRDQKHREKRKTKQCAFRSMLFFSIASKPISHLSHAQLVRVLHHLWRRRQRRARHRGGARATRAFGGVVLPRRRAHELLLLSLSLLFRVKEREKVERRVCLFFVFLLLSVSDLDPDPSKTESALARLPPCFSERSFSSGTNNK